LPSIIFGFHVCVMSGAAGADAIDQDDGPM
jgi:hypothetical protein